jgi:hypothetical protein
MSEPGQDHQNGCVNPIVTWFPPADWTKSEFPVSRSKSAQEIVSAKPRRWLWSGMPGPVFLESMGGIDLALRNLQHAAGLYSSTSLWHYGATASTSCCRPLPFYRISEATP